MVFLNGVREDVWLSFGGANQPYITQINKTTLILTVNRFFHNVIYIITLVL